MQVQATIQKWGNSLALRLTGQLRTIPHFEENMRVNIEIQEEGIQVRPARDKLKKKLFREADLLRGLNDTDKKSQKFCKSCAEAKKS